MLTPTENRRNQRLLCFSSTFQGISNFQGLFKKALLIQVLFKPVRTLVHLIVCFDSLCLSQQLYRDMGAQWLSGRVLDSRLKGRGFEPHPRHCVVVLERDTFILA